MDPIFSQQFTMPPPRPQAGMFGGGEASWRNAVMAAIAGFMARRNPQVANNIINGLQDAQTMKQKMALAQQERQQRIQDQRDQFTFEQQYRADHPTPGQPGEFETALQASGVQPGTPEWVHAMQQRTQNFLDPVVMTPQGPMLRSQVVGALSPPTAPVGKLTPIGGPTPQASGGFPGY